MTKKDSRQKGKTNANGAETQLEKTKPNTNLASELRQELMNPSTM